MSHNVRCKRVRILRRGKLRFKGLGNPMMSCSLSPYVDDAKVADVVIPHALRRPHVQGPQYMHKFLLVDGSSNL